MEKKHPALSVILPFHNAEKTLQQAIQSISEQTFADFECMLIDNNSTDGSGEIARTYCQKDKRFQIISESKQGVIHAHNAGLRQAEGQYIARMDADDWMYPDRLEIQVKFLSDHPECDVVAGQATYVPHQPHTEGFLRYVHWSNSLLSHDDISLNRFVESPVINPTAMWRRKLAEKFGSYHDGPFPEDYELWLRWLSEGVRFHKLSVPVIKWFDSEDRLSRTDQRYSDEAFFSIKTQYLAQWLKIHNPFHPEVVVWGASKISRKRAVMLETSGISIQKYIDISTKRCLDKSVLHYEAIPPPGNIFILVYLKQEVMRANTCAFLHDRGYVHGRDYLLAS